MAGGVCLIKPITFSTGDSRLSNQYKRIVKRTCRFVSSQHDARCCLLCAGGGATGGAPPERGRLGQGPDDGEVRGDSKHQVQLGPRAGGGDALAGRRRRLATVGAGPGGKQQTLGAAGGGEPARVRLPAYQAARG